MKNKILTAVIALWLAVAGSSATAAFQQNDESPVIEILEENITVESAPDVDISNGSDIVIPESNIARKMTQAEKNQNAAENDGWGGAITIIAMCIVISALAVLSILFLIFGKVSEAILTSKKKKAKQAAEHEPHENDQHLASGEVIAAIAAALSEHFGEGHDVEDTILTIRRMQKAYSPWNSKIYNLRPAQDHHRNQLTDINFHESKRIQI